MTKLILAKRLHYISSYFGPSFFSFLKIVSNFGVFSMAVFIVLLNLYELMILLGWLGFLDNI